MSATSPLATFLFNRWRVLAAGAVGAAAGFWVQHQGTLNGASFLIGWNVAAFVFIVPTAWMLFRSDSEDMRARAKSEDEDRAVLMGVILAAVGASLVAIIVALKESKPHDGHGGQSAWIMALSVSTLALSWLVIQSLYTVHYAHRYFGDRDDDGEPDGGIEFPGAPPQTYRDFIYVAVCIGATCQVSDFDITTTKFRNLVTTHAVISFVFNTMVLALGINIIGNLMGQ